MDLLHAWQRGHRHSSQDCNQPTIMNGEDYALRQELRGHEEDVSSIEVLSHAQMVFVADGPCMLHDRI